jgi:hypothetical protein
MSFHAPFQAIPNAGFCAIIFAKLMIVYYLDAFYTKVFMTEHIGTFKYETSKSGTQIAMGVSDRFAKTTCWWIWLYHVGMDEQTPMATKIQ